MKPFVCSFSAALIYLSVERVTDWKLWGLAFLLSAVAGAVVAMIRKKLKDREKDSR